ncbi:MAG: cytochrome-c peroxidase [Pseudomonadota bacterium]
MTKFVNSLLILTTGVLLSCSAVYAQKKDKDDRTLEPIQPVELPTDLDMPKVELGKKLFFDPRLSLSGWISCNSCHNLSMGGSDNLVSSIGHHWAEGPINAPTVLNSSYNLAQFWDGRALTLQEQAAGPIANPGEMASTHTLAVEVLNTIPGYVEEFSAAFGRAPIDLDMVTAAIAEFERTLVTPDSRFDLWLKGDDGALTEQELAGYQLFKLTGCIGCHNGPAVGGNAYQKMGSFNRYETLNPATGRMAVTGVTLDRMRFKVPNLRNIELTYPYFHDGQVRTLEDAVNTMVWVQLNRHFADAGTAKIVAFLKTLTGKQPSFGIPQLPPSGPNTPAPQPFGP